MTITDLQMISQAFALDQENAVFNFMQLTVKILSRHHVQEREFFVVRVSLHAHKTLCTYSKIEVDDDGMRFTERAYHRYDCSSKEQHFHQCCNALEDGTSVSDIGNNAAAS
jgi:hypothetical protein